VRVGRLFQVGDARLRAHERAARVDAVHEVVLLHRRRLGAGQVDGRGVVDQDVDAAEGLHGLLDRLGDLVLEADVDRERERLAAGRDDLLGSREDGARQLGVRIGGLRDDRDVGAVARGAQRDGLADATAGTGDEERLALERHVADASTAFTFIRTQAGGGRRGPRRMSYRDDIEALAARRAAPDVDGAARQRELDQTSALLEEARAKARLPVLDDIRVAAPCSVSWEGMVGDARVRACGACKQNVYNLSEMTRGEAQELLLEHEGRLCVRYYRRADGTIITKQCSLGLRRRRRRRIIAAAVVSTLAGAG